MNWIKKGKIFEAVGQYGWMNSHAQIPSVMVMKDRFRVYFSTRKVRTESKTTYVDLDLQDPSKVLYLHPEPILENGTPGTFDEHGVMPSSVLEDNGKIYLYYSGWSKRTNVPYNNLTGLAISEDGGKSFKKIGAGPILSQNILEPFSATSPHVFKEGDQWHMHYCSGTAWLQVNGKFEHVYDIKYASSKDGIQWHQNGLSVIPSAFEGEALTRPVVIKHEEEYQIYYCHRGSHDFRNGADAYRIGRATSKDLKNWERNDSYSGINTSVDQHEWDSLMLSYPYPIMANEKYYLFYNGNGFGESGFGYAVAE
jgi:predicted GH43/DUF377 family glycosyl hydrolase